MGGGDFFLLRLQRDAVHHDMEGMAAEDETTWQSGSKREVEEGAGYRIQSRPLSDKSLPSLGTITSQVPLTSRGSSIQTHEPTGDSSLSNYNKHSVYPEARKTVFQCRFPLGFNIFKPLILT